MSSLLLLLSATYLISCHSVITEEGQAIDSFYDEDDASNWVILSGTVNDALSSKWDVDEVWDTIDEDLQTQKGHFASRKCQNLFGKIVCLCQFKRLMGEQHRCRQSLPKELHRQKMIRSHSTLGRGIATAARLPYNRVQLPYNELNSIRQEQAIDNQYAAQIEDDNQIEEGLNAEDLQELEDDIEEMIEEEKGLIEEQEDEVEDDLFEEALEELETDDDDTDAWDEALVDEDDLDEEYDEEELDAGDEDEAYDEEMIDALDEEVEEQSSIIDKQHELIEELKEDNAMKEALIEVMDDEETDLDGDLDEESDVIYDDDETEQYEDENDAANDDDYAFNDEYYEDDNVDVALDNEEEDEQYYDDVDQDEELAHEEYNELYDDGEEKNDEVYDDQYIDEEYRENNVDQEDIREQEAKAMIADTFWGLEIYTVAFMVLCCCCISCYCYKTKCCGYFKTKDGTESFGYARYAHQGGFNKVFGNVDDEDVEMGKCEPNISDEAEMLQS
eukprot:526610_1